ncbi:MAG: hypothetical protein GY941_28400 [Planctomycetes bacterium]|nr:hypothetical protein [Planctomycetota bacterium]
MNKRSHTLRLPMGIPCEAGKFDKETDKWTYSESLIHKVDKDYLILQTQQTLEVDESIRLILFTSTCNNSGSGYTEPEIATERDDQYIEATVVRHCNTLTDMYPGYGVMVSNRSVADNHHTHGKAVERRKGVRRKGERRITDRKIIELIELASEIGMDNVVYRSGCYAPKSTRQASTDRRILLDRRDLKYEHTRVH